MQTLSRAFLENEFGNEENLDEIVHGREKCSRKRKRTQSSVESSAISSWMADRPDKGERAMENVLEADLVFIEDRAMVPMTLQNMMREKVHEGHFGDNRTILRAKSIMSDLREIPAVKQKAAVDASSSHELSFSENCH